MKGKWTRLWRDYFRNAAFAASLFQKSRQTRRGFLKSRGGRKPVVRLRASARTGRDCEFVVGAIAPHLKPVPQRVGGIGRLVRIARLNAFG